jgi:hypothetical protein
MTMFKWLRGGGDSSGQAPYRRSLAAVGVVFHQEQREGDAPVAHPLLGAYLAQLAGEGLLTDEPDGRLLRWDDVYHVLSRDDYSGFHKLLLLPLETEAKPRLCSRNSLVDSDFSIFVDGWRHKSGEIARFMTDCPILRFDDTTQLMKQKQWELFKAVREFSARDEENRNEMAQRRTWGKIRLLALAAEAELDDFLCRVVVLTPEKLDIALRRSDVAGDRVVEIEPGFADVPESWLSAFDRHNRVFDRYDLPTPDGIVQVLIMPQVRTVLEEIKRFPGRRMAGVRAQGFVRNPFAALGDDAAAVIDEAQFEKARTAAGLDYERFVPAIRKDDQGNPAEIGILIETVKSTGHFSSETLWLDNEELDGFLKKANAALSRDFQLLSWQGYELEIDGDTPRHIEELSEALSRRLRPIITYAQVYDLGAYSERIAEIGYENPYYSPYIAKEDEDEGWFPKNITFVVAYCPEGAEQPVYVRVSRETIEHMKDAVQEATESGLRSITVPGLPEPMALTEAGTILRTIEEVTEDVEKGMFDPEKPPTAKRNVKRKQLVILPNIETLDYEEERKKTLVALPAEPRIPETIKEGMFLLDHQKRGLAWLQHLYNLRSRFHVRGAILADDMGLGKTFQLLALMAHLIETEPGIDPMLVVAPISLLENWVEETLKFFKPDTFPLQLVYGANLGSLRAHRTEIDEQLQSENLVKFLRPGWVGDAKLVLTTYETLRDYEFSFAAVNWSVMVCDEAQKIKNPNAMMTRAVKKQKVGFKIACTGTPVENNLTDLWCLFDYVQPGLLGALSDFGKKYRKPIEAKTADESMRVEELRARIAPQILRRLKSEVASNLPRKIIVGNCQNLHMSDSQRNLYSAALRSFERNHTAGGGRSGDGLGLLYYLRRVCADPQSIARADDKPEPLSEYRAKAPKMDWLLSELQEIKNKGEKAIIFCELKDTQRLLRHYIKEALGYGADIINGDTRVSIRDVNSRLGRITKFQEKGGFGVLILSPLAVGFGVNIQRANHVIHYTRMWNPAKEDQATDRAYRIGQQKDVYVYCPTVTADDFTTFEVKLDRLLAGKRELAADMLNGSGELKFEEFELFEPVADAAPG